MTKKAIHYEAPRTKIPEAGAPLCGGHEGCRYYRSDLSGDIREVTCKKCRAKRLADGGHCIDCEFFKTFIQTQRSHVDIHRAYTYEHKLVEGPGVCVCKESPKKGCIMEGEVGNCECFEVVRQ